jgi:hypothetical protein
LTSNLESASEESKIKRLVVAVHGIGNQFRYATIQATASRFMAYCGVKNMTLPLGAFHPEKLIRRPDSPEVGAYLFKPPPRYEGVLDGLGFAEVFWADIPERAAATNNTTEESKAWARTIVDRLRLIDELADGPSSNLIDYRKAATVIEEMIDTIQILENLLFLAKKAGILDFQLGQLLTDFLGDVQIVADFKDYGGMVFQRFLNTMQNLARRFKDLKEIYIVAHSEGTVVSLRALLLAMKAQPDESNAWVDKVAGFMTIGSPLNKHIVLWPNLWKDLVPNTARKRQAPIFWRNYYDLGDPVGFDLQITRDWLKENRWLNDQQNTAGGAIFTFREQDDFGFTRYPFPGKAHNDYWQDDEVFGHFIQEVVIGKGKKSAPRPATFLWTTFVSNVFPYFLIFTLLAVGTYVLYQACNSLLQSGATAPKASPHTTPQLFQTARDVFGISCLLAGITVLGRITRVERLPWNLVIGVLAFALGSVGLKVATHNTRQQLALPFAHSNFGLILACFLIAGFSAITSKWRPEWRMRPLIVLGGITAMWIVWHLFGPNEQILSKPIWQLVLANAAFLYLWWLSALLFDLVYIWQQFVRSNRTTRTLREIRPKPQSGAIP